MSLNTPVLSALSLVVLMHPLTSAQVLTSGMVTDTFACPIPGAEVKVHRKGQVIATTRSDEDGRFAVSIPPDAEVKIESPGFVTFRHAPAAEATLDVTLRPETLGTSPRLEVPVRVVDEEGTPLPDASLSVLDLPGLTVRHRRALVSGGVATLYLPRGPSLLVATAPGRGATTAIVQLLHSPASIVMTLPKGSCQ